MRNEHLDARGLPPRGAGPTPKVGSKGGSSDGSPLFQRGSPTGSGAWGFHGAIDSSRVPARYSDLLARTIANTQPVSYGRTTPDRQSLGGIHGRRPWLHTTVNAGSPHPRPERSRSR